MMGNFKLNPNFNDWLTNAFSQFVDDYFALVQEVLNKPRVWEGWETSEPFRDIVDTGDLRDSGVVTQWDQFYYVLSWSTDYVQLVYFGYALADGRRIPPRKWAELAIRENDLLQTFYKRLLENLQ